MKKLTIIIIAIIIILVIFLAGYFLYILTVSKIHTTPENTEQDTTDVNPCEELGCTADDIYVGSVNSDKYYECSCHYAQRINPENIVCFKNDAEALADGRTKSEC